MVVNLADKAETSRDGKSLLFSSYFTAGRRSRFHITLCCIKKKKQSAECKALANFPTSVKGEEQTDSLHSFVFLFY